MTDDQGVSRRDFLRAATLTAVAATAAGGGAAAFVRSRQAEPVITVASNPTTLPGAVVSVPTPAISGASTAAATSGSADTLALLAQAQSENLQLKAQLDQALQQLAGLQTSEADSRAARDTLQMELDGANNRLGILGGLVALYQQLDDMDPGAAVEGGLQALGTKLTELVDGTPLLNSGLDTGTLALSEMEAHIPTLDSGRQWLAEQTARVQGFYSQVELVLQEALERVGDFFQMLAEWFEGIRKWLPFGVGDKAAKVMSNLTTLVAETPNTLAGLQANIATPLDVWLVREEGEPVLQRRVVRPLRDEVIARARVTIDQTHQTHTVYNDNLASPVRAVFANRQTVRDQIAAYRQQNQV